MDMVAVLVRGLALFTLCLSIHVLIWRCRAIRSHAAWLVLIFILFPGGVLGGTAVLGKVSTAWFLSYVLHGSLALAYMVMYTAVRSFSPSVAILDKVARSMPAGVEPDGLRPEWFTDSRLSGLRWQNLAAGAFISVTGGILTLEPRGRLVARAFLLFRRSLGLPDLAKG